MMESRIHHLDTDESPREKARWDLCKNATSYIEQILGATFHKPAAVQQPTSHL